MRCKKCTFSLCYGYLMWLSTMVAAERGVTSATLAASSGPISRVMTPRTITDYSNTKFRPHNYDKTSKTGAMSARTKQQNAVSQKMFCSPSWQELSSVPFIKRLSIRKYFCFEKCM